MVAVSSGSMRRRASGRKQNFRGLEIQPDGFSEAWKSGWNFFQALEKTDHFFRTLEL
jgi:hypothetical protein